MSEFYTKAQINQIVGVIGQRTKQRTDPQTLANAIYSLPDHNQFTDGERTKLASIEGSKFLGTFLDVSRIPTINATDGSYADVDAGAGSDIKRYVWDVSDNKFVALASQVGGETAASIKQKYEGNANTNAFTDDLKRKLEGITEAADISEATAALDGAMA